MFYKSFIKVRVCVCVCHKSRLFKPPTLVMKLVLTLPVIFRPYVNPYDDDLQMFEQQIASARLKRNVIFFFYAWIVRKVYNHLKKKKEKKKKVIIIFIIIFLNIKIWFPDIRYSRALCNFVLRKLKETWKKKNLRR